MLTKCGDAKDMDCIIKIITHGQQSNNYAIIQDERSGHAMP